LLRLEGQRGTLAATQEEREKRESPSSNAPVLPFLLRKYPRDGYAAFKVTV
jgi:hypothetical protein